MIFSRWNDTNIDEISSHQTYSVIYQIDRKGVGNIIDLGSVTLLLVWFDYNRLIRPSGAFLGLSA